MNVIVKAEQVQRIVLQVLEFAATSRRFFEFWFWEGKPSKGRKVGIPREILPHVQGAVRAKLKPLFQAGRVGSALFQS